jgi:hypothetical protein
MTRKFNLECSRKEIWCSKKYCPYYERTRLNKHQTIRVLTSLEGAIMLSKMDEKDLARLVNSDSIKKFYV